MKSWIAIVIGGTLLAIVGEAFAQDVIWRCGIEESDGNYGGISDSYYLILKGPNDEAKIRPHCEKFERWLSTNYPAKSPHRKPYWVDDAISTMWEAPASATAKDGVEIQKDQYKELGGNRLYFTYKNNGQIVAD